MNNKIFSFFLVLILFVSVSCSVGDKELASGTYNLSLISPEGQNHGGQAYLDQIGTMLTMQIYSSAGNFNFAGELNASSTSAPNRFEADGADNERIKVEFSASRSSFTGSIEVGVDTTDTGTTSISEIYLVSGEKI